MFVEIYYIILTLKGSEGFSSTVGNLWVSSGHLKL